MRRIRGFTVLELVVVLAILVVLAGVIVGRLDLLQMKANKGVAASNMAGISRMVRTYRTARNVYPDNWDSLLDSTGAALWNATATTVGLEPQLTGTPVAGSPIKLTTTTLVEDATTHEVRSLSRMGITTLWNAPATYSGAPGNAFGSTGLSSTLANGVTVATINAADSDGKAIIDEIYYPANVNGVSGTIPANSKLVVFGLGPRSDLVRNGSDGALLESAPFYSNQDQNKYYNRYLCVFEVSAKGSRAKLVAVLGADGDRLAEEIGDFYE